MNMIEKKELVQIYTNLLGEYVKLSGAAVLPLRNMIFNTGFIVLSLSLVSFTFGEEDSKSSITPKTITLVPCTCGVFLSGQFQKGFRAQPKGHPALTFEQGDYFQCNAIGQKQCLNKCLEGLVRHLPSSPGIVCAAMDRDAFRERAYLFTKNCKDVWVNTNLAAGREYCCKDGVHQKCPSLLA